MSGNYIAAAEAVYDADSLLIDFETGFLQSVLANVGATWADRFAYVPGRAFRNLDVRFPVDLTAFGFSAWSGKHEFREAASEYIDLTITEWQEGAQLDVRKLRDPISQEIIMWDQREAGIIASYARLFPSQLYTTLSLGDATGTWRLTGGSNFFATDHKVNKKNPGLGTFANLIGDGGAKAASPWYFVLGGGPFERLAPWVKLVGEGMGPTIAKAGGGTMSPRASAGQPCVFRWGTDSEQFKDTFKCKVSVMMEMGHGLMFPQSIIRNENALTYANLKATLDAAIAFKDFAGYNPADQITIKAILCEPGDVSTINGLLGREVVNVGASSPSDAQSAIDPRLKMVPIVALAH